MKGKTFFFVTTIRVYFDKKVKRELHDSRCIGFYPTLRSARGIVKEKASWLEENGWYKYVVIEEFGFGWYPWQPCNVEEWYVFVNKEKIEGKTKTVKINKPRKWKQVVSWGIG